MRRPSLRQLIGWSHPVSLLVFVGCDSGRVRPHGYYEVCSAAGKLAACQPRERQPEGVRVLEIPFDPSASAVLRVDCAGILKLRNSDVETRRSAGRSSRRKSAKARLVFRVTLPLGAGNSITLQTASEPILCTQPVGSPEIHRISASGSSALGGTDLFVIGRNFAKGAQVLLQEVAEGKGIVWQAEAKVEREFLSNTHLICCLPPYAATNLRQPVVVQLAVRCGGRQSEPVYFTYTPAACVTEVPPADAEAKPTLDCVSPLALRYNQMIQRASTQPPSDQQLPSSSSSSSSWTKQPPSVGEAPAEVGGFVDLTAPALDSLLADSGADKW